MFLCGLRDVENSRCRVWDPCSLGRVSVDMDGLDEQGWGITAQQQ